MLGRQRLSADVIRMHLEKFNGFGSYLTECMTAMRHMLEKRQFANVDLTEQKQLMQQKIRAILTTNGIAILCIETSDE